MLSYLDYIKDKRVECYSVLVKIKISDFLSFIKSVYENRGGIEGQRSALKTKSAQRIRQRLVEDLVKGTVIPPIVIGIRLNDSDFGEFEKDIATNSKTIFDKLDKQEQVSVIDGMQRTTALLEALNSSKFNSNETIRLELWVAKSTNSLIYRMLVLNSGQIPWNIRKQLEVVFSQLKNELESNVGGLELFESEDNSRRIKAGQYQADKFIELFMLFATRRVAIDLQEQLAEEFARLDIVETTGNDESTKMFYGVSKLLVGLDTVFTKLTINPSPIELKKFRTGKDIFSSQPARAGFIVAASQEIFGIPGVELSQEKQKERYEKIISCVNQFIKFLDKKTPEELFEVLDLPTLDEQIDVKASKVGAFERDFFFQSFKTFFDLAKSDCLENLTPCWRTSH